MQRRGWLSANCGGYGPRADPVKFPNFENTNSGTLIIWDKLFGTFEPEDPSDPPRFGLTKNINSYNPVRIAVHELSTCFAMPGPLPAGATSSATSLATPVGATNTLLESVSFRAPLSQSQSNILVSGCPSLRHFEGWVLVLIFVFQ